MSTLVALRLPSSVQLMSRVTSPMKSRRSKCERVLLSQSPAHRIVSLNPWLRHSAPKLRDYSLLPNLAQDTADILALSSIVGVYP